MDISPPGLLYTWFIISGFLRYSSICRSKRKISLGMNICLCRSYLYIIRGSVYIGKSSGPKIEPWGTPKEIVKYFYYL